MTSTIPHSPESTSQAILRQHLVAREAEEERLIEFYARLAWEAPEPLCGIASAMLDDGAAHHEMVEKLLATWATPVADGQAGNEWHLHRHSQSTECFFAARRFLESQRDELARLQAWAGESDSHRDAMFFTLFLRLLELDAAKHTAVLDFVRHTTDPVTVA